MQIAVLSRLRTYHACLNSDHRHLLSHQPCCTFLKLRLPAPRLWHGMYVRAGFKDRSCIFKHAPQERFLIHSPFFLESICTFSQVPSISRDKEWKKFKLIGVLWVGKSKDLYSRYRARCYTYAIKQSPQFKADPLTISTGFSGRPWYTTYRWRFHQQFSHMLFGLDFQVSSQVNRLTQSGSHISRTFSS